MTFDAHLNFAYSTIATPVPSPAASGTSLVVAAGTGALFPTAPFNAVIWPAGTQPSTTNAEIVRVTAISTDTFTITRAQESTSARTNIAIGDQIMAGITKKTITDIENNFSLYATLASPTFTGTVTAAASAFTGAMVVQSGNQANTASRTEITATSTQTWATTASMVHTAMSFSGIDTWSVVPSGTNMFVGYANAGTFQNDASTAGINLSPIVSFNAGYTKTMDTLTGRSMGTDVDFRSSPLFNVANSGTFTSAGHTSFSASGTLNATGSTMTSHTGFSAVFVVTAGTVSTLTHYLASNPVNSGTITTLIGLDIASLTSGGTNIGIRNKSNTQLGSSAQLTVDTSGNLSTSGGLTTTGSGALTVAGTAAITGHVTLEGVTSTGAVGSGNLVFDGTPTLITPNIGAATGTSLAATGAVKSSGASGGVGYATGAGNAVSQTSTKSTAFPTINALCGTLTWVSAALASDISVTSGSSTNTAIAATDVVVFNHISGGTVGAYTMTCTPGSGTWTLTLRNTHSASLTEAPKFAFAIIKAVTS